ncbi:FecR domain-containing protein [Bosea sp. 2RAB26]|uniref:FecR domain-containing protein n=1 Tax=Bosea sp. 2RAB26 TaxID=3237476 RepID=UPI003F90569C
MRFLRFSIAACAICASIPPAAAQQPTGCTPSARTDPPRTVFRCSGGLIIEAEAATRFQVQSPQPGRAIQSIALDGKGLLVELPRRRGPLQILTPHAIASVRGTIYAVDVTTSKTSVFVAEGRVRVTRRDGTDPVELNPGDGVDVSQEKRLDVHRWSRERAAGLLARFGR